MDADLMDMICAASAGVDSTGRATGVVPTNADIMGVIGAAIDESAGEIAEAGARNAPEGEDAGFFSRNKKRKGEGNPKRGARSRQPFQVTLDSFTQDLNESEAIELSNGVSVVSPEAESCEGIYLLYGACLQVQPWLESQRSAP